MNRMLGKNLGSDARSWGGLLREERETPACQINLIMRWDVWESVGAKTIGDDSRFVVVCPVIWVRVVSDTLLPSGRGAHLL